MLKNVPKFADENLIVGTETSDDASVYRLTDEIAIINTTDYFTPIVDDPYTFGQIAATNALSDVYSMGGVPKTALNVVCWNSDQLELEILTEILRGGADKVIEAGAVIGGGHTVTGPEILYGLALTGVVHPDRVVRNFGAQPGDCLILTKKLGIGILTTALKFDEIGDEILPKIVESMTRLNKTAGEIMIKFGATACTDITGFGLLGHAFEMAMGNNARIEFNSDQIPIFTNVKKLAGKDLYTRAFTVNSTFLKNKVSFSENVSDPMKQITMEAETSGGLLFALPESNADHALEALHNADCPEAKIIGRVIDHAGPSIEVL